MGKKKKKADVLRTEKDPQKLKMYKEAAERIEELYIKPWFGSAGSKPEIMDTSENGDFEILSTMRYDPLIAGPSETKGDISSLIREFGDEIDFLNDGVLPVKLEANEANDYNSNLFFLFNEHHARINVALSYFNFGFEVDRVDFLENLNSVIGPLNKSKPYRLRITVNKKGDVHITVHETPTRLNLLDGLTCNSIEEYIAGGSPVWNVHIDSEPIFISPFTSFKTTLRDHYNSARERKIPKLTPQELQMSPHEVLLYSTAHHLTEGSITNVAVLKYDEDAGEFCWFTPVLASGCLCGVVRHMLLVKGFIKEKLLTLKDVKVGDQVLLFNGLIGVVKGRIVD